MQTNNKGERKMKQKEVVLNDEQPLASDFHPEGLGETIFNQRYAHRDGESWETACRRVANHVAQAENGSRPKWEGRFYEKLSESLFVAGGRIWYGSGRAKGQLLNCFVVPTDDSREGWGQTIKDMLIISGTGGGVGINCSPVRPRGTPIRGTGGEATGAVSLMEIINQTGEVIKAGGGRRTALMLCLDYNHGDIMEFLDAKLDLGRLNNANVSVLVDQDFFDAVENNEDITLKFRGQAISEGKVEVDEKGEPIGAVETRTVSARMLWDRIIENSYNSAEPGILNVGLANKMNNIHYYKPLISTNPCGEIWLEEYGCCCLGAINLSRHITDGKLDWDLLSDSVTVGVRFLDNVLDVNQYPLKQIEENCRRVRRIGLGVMGLGHALVKMGVKYGSDEGNEVVEKIMKFIKERAYEASIFLAVERGSFEAYDEQFLQSGFVKTLPRRIKGYLKEHGIRNCAILTIAPTGTTSIMAGTSSGIEPVFAAGYVRRYYDSDPTSNKRVLKKEVVIDPLFQQLYEEGADMSAFVSSRDLTVEDHMKVQAICQKHIDNSISKTINIPADYPIEDYGNLMLKYGPLLKGLTVYRSGSRGDEPLSPITVEEAIKHLNKNGVKIGAAQSDCPSGVCSISDA
jgi:ribonucleoside-diphosphate reductase alpha chain